MDPGLALEVAALSRIKDMEALEAKGESPIQHAYRGGTAFITGASGFLGKHFVEKLLRSTDIRRIYLLMRPKKGKSVTERRDAILADPLFDRLHKTKPGFSDKIQIVEGDIQAIQLGISEKDQATLSKEVTFIFHIAATTRFDEPLPQATITNVRGTREVVKLAKTCRNLSSFIHISTAYSHATWSRVKTDVLEEFYDVPISPEQLIDMVEKNDVEGLNHLEKTLLQDWPNTYAITKAVAEEVIRTQTAGLPASIVRPSIVISAYREPAPGWVDMSAAYGPAGVRILK
ncbi:male sterility protein domain-containing protein [Phthorimaea operculella]|nr:male sterility protein domain-containing protein [Phthorimaea operculella]